MRSSRAVWILAVCSLLTSAAWLAAETADSGEKPLALGGLDPVSLVAGEEVAGKESLTASDERLKRQRRVQYSLFLQVIDVETSLIKFQQTVDRTKAVKG